ncbi:MAG: hypothetical protein CL928_13495 [Deltaproteobacteria bacterium]|nr:hypothetical protein [Deltaproteobacteria bacterium]
MHWALFGGGKRLRPVLALAAFEAVDHHRDRPYEAVLPAACAVEMIHTYSLIHDDLPAMDDDDERRGRPTTHVRYGEDLAILAGDALLTEALRLVLDRDAYRGGADATRIIEVGRTLAEAAGWRGMVGGQSTDLGHEGAVDSEEALTFLHRRKTGELFRYAAMAGATLADGSPEEVEALAEYGETLGLAFQVVDDLLDDEQDRRDGKPQAQEPSFPALLGLEESRRRAEQLHQRALSLLSPFGTSADPLRLLMTFAVERDH